MDTPPTASPSSTDGEPGSQARGRAREVWLDRWIMLAIFTLAVVVRLGLIHSSGGLRTLNGYDDGVYFSATAGLLHGLVPYRDFVLLHPPGILVLAAGPIALAQAIGLSDADALVVMRALFVGLGAVAAVLAFLAGRHLSRPAGVVAACLYCVWGPAIREERTMLLEPLVILATLSALVLIPPVSTRLVAGRWRPIMAGVVAGVAIATKLWAIVPIVVIGASLLLVRRWRRALAFLGTAGGTALAVAAPFLAGAPAQMWQMVVASQIGRPSVPENRLVRFAELGNLGAWPFSVLSHPTWPPLDPVSPAVAEQQLSQSGRVAEVVVVVVLGLVALAVVAALRLPPARLWVALVAVQSAVLLATPVFFDGYASFVAPAGVLLVGAGAHLVWTSGLLRRRPVLRPLTTSAAALVLLAIGWGAVMTDRGGPVRPGLAQQVAAARCVASDSPVLLVLVDRLRTNLRNGCPPVFDFSGVAYTLDVPRDRPISPTTLRAESEQYQQFVQDYFAQAEYVILRRRTATGISEATMALLEQRPLVRSSPRVFGPPGAPSVPDQVPDGELQPDEEGDADAGA